MLALSIRQPFVELILRGIKTVEYRSRPTRIIGERFFLYACKGGKWNAECRMPNAESKRPIQADNLVVPQEPLAVWMIELAEQIKLIGPGGQLG